MYLTTENASEYVGKTLDAKHHPQKFWDDYEVNDGLFVVKKKGAWIAFYSMDIIACMVVG